MPSYFEANQRMLLFMTWLLPSAAGALSNVLQEVELPILDSRACGELLKKLNVPPVHNTVLCAGFPDGGKDACKVGIKWTEL